MREEAKANEETDRQAKERIDKLNHADSMIFNTEKQLKEYGDKIPADKKATIEGSLEKLKEAHKSQDVAAIDAAMEAINAAWQAASGDMYKDQAGAPQGDPNAGAQANPNAGKKDGEVTDVDFEEVK